jgi:outer membrane protein assembly factor BamB
VNDLIYQRGLLSLAAALGFALVLGILSRRATGRLRWASLGALVVLVFLSGVPLAVFYLIGVSHLPSNHSLDAQLLAGLLAVLLAIECALGMRRGWARGLIGVARVACAWLIDCAAAAALLIGSFVGLFQTGCLGAVLLGGALGLSMIWLWVILSAQFWMVAGGLALVVAAAGILRGVVIGRPSRISRGQALPALAAATGAFAVLGFSGLLIYGVFKLGSPAAGSASPSASTPRQVDTSCNPAVDHSGVALAAPLRPSHQDLTAALHGRAWQSPGPVAADMPPAPAGDEVLVHGDQTLWALDRLSGRKLWQTVARDGGVPAVPSRSGGFVFLSDFDGLRTVSDRTGAEVISAASATSLAGPFLVQANRLYHADTFGDFRATLLSPRAVIWDTKQVGVPQVSPLLAGDRVVALVKDFAGFHRSVVVLDGSRGDLLWRHSLGDNPAENLSVALGSRLVLVASGTEIRALEPSTGVVVWTFRTRGSSPWPLLTAGDLVLSLDGAGTLSGIEGPTGKERWCRGVGRNWGMAIAAGNVHVGAGGYLYTFDAITGASRGRIKADQGVQPPSADDTYVYVATPGSITAYR